MSTPTDEEFVQLATRVPKRLHRALKLHCVKNEQSVMDFVVTALAKALPRNGKKRQKVNGPPGFSGLH